ncbi:MAG: hypothetical protein VX777_03100 [Chlamydiota bacterium]|nr:hypothetical protein [Chlamydiota bacterium]
MQGLKRTSNCCKWDYALYGASEFNTHQENLLTINSITSKHEALSYNYSTNMFTKRAGETGSWGGYITQQICQITDAGASAKCVADGMQKVFQSIHTDFLELTSRILAYENGDSKTYMPSKQVFNRIFNDLHDIIKEIMNRAMLYISAHYSEKLAAQQNSYSWAINLEKIAEYRSAIQSIGSTRKYIKHELLATINDFIVGHLGEE